MIIYAASLSVDNAYNKTTNTLRLTGLSVSLINNITVKSFASLSVEPCYDKTISMLLIKQVTLSVISNIYTNQFVSLSIYPKKGFVMIADMIEGISIYI